MQLEFDAEIAKTIKKELGISCFPDGRIYPKCYGCFVVETVQVFNPRINSVLNKFELINNFNNLV